MAAPGNDLLSEIENGGGLFTKLGVYLRSYLIPTVQQRGLAGQVYATPPDKPGDSSLQDLKSLIGQQNPPNSQYVGTNNTGQIVPAATPTSGITQLTGDVSAGPGSGPQNATVTRVNAGAIPVSEAYVGTNAAGQIIAAATPSSGITQLTGDVTAGPGSGPQASQVTATHLAAPLPVAQGGSGTATPSLVAGSNVTITGSWPNQTVAATATGFANPMTTQGDLIVGGAAGAAQRLAAGTAGQVLTSNGPGTLPSYQPGGSGGGVVSLNSLTGALSLVAGSNVTITPSGSNITIASTGGGGGGGYIATPPSSSTSTGTAGQYSFDTDGTHGFFCYATNAWAKIPMVAPFENPPVTSGLILYFDANMYSYSNGSAASELFDLTGNGFNAISAAGATFLTNQINSRAALSFPGTANGRYTIASGFFAPNVTVFAVAKAAASANMDFLCGVTAALNFRFAANGGGVSPGLVTAGVQNIGNSTVIVALNTFAQFNATLDSSGNYAFRVAQAAAGSGAYSGTMPSQPSTTIGWQNISGPEDYNGEIAELIVYNRVLTSTEIASIEAWLHGKYGI